MAAAVSICLKILLLSFVSSSRSDPSDFNSYSASRDNWCTVEGDGGCRVGEVRAGTTSPMPNHKGFKATVTSTFSEIQHFKG